MEKNKKTKSDIACTAVNFAVVAVVLVCAVIIYFIKGFSWFTQNRTVDANGATLQLTSSALGTVSLYEYDPETKALVAATDITLDAAPTEERTFVLMLSNNYSSNVDFTLSLLDLSVNYYALQKYTDSAQLDVFLEQYIRAGKYLKADSTVLDYMSVTTEQYLSFVHPCSNAFKLKTGAVLTAGQADALAYTASQIASNTVAYGTEQPLFESTHSVTSVSANAAADRVYVLDQNVLRTDYFSLDGTGTYPSFAPQTVAVGQSTALVITLRFDETVYSKSTVDGAEVTLQNSNPFMFQRLKIGRVKCDTIAH